MSVLRLTNCDLGSAALDLLSDVVPTMTSLQKLLIGINKPGAGGAVKLLLALAHLPRLETLNMALMNIGCEDIRALSPLITPSDRTHLKSLDIGDRSMSTECVELMMMTLLSPSSLETLLIFQTNLTTSHSCFALLQENSNLRTLDVNLCPIGSHTTSSLARALETNSIMEELDISSLTVPVAHQIGTDGAVALSLALRANKVLKKLWIKSDKSIGKTGARALVTTLQHNRTLRLLSLRKDYSKHFTSVKVDSRIKCKIEF